MQNPFKEFLYFSRGERRGILVLITGIILVFLSGYIYIYQRENRPLSDEVIRRQATAMAEYESFIASIQEKEQKWDNRLKPSSQKQPTTVSLARFNPNIADSVIFADWDCPDGWRGTYSATVVKEGSSIRQKISGNIWNDRKTISDTLTLYPHHSGRHRNKNRPVIQLSCKQ